MSTLTETFAVVDVVELLMHFNNILSLFVVKRIWKPDKMSYFFYFTLFLFLVGFLILLVYSAIALVVFLVLFLVKPRSCFMTGSEDGRDNSNPKM